MRGNHPPTLGLSNTSDHPLDGYSTAYLERSDGRSYDAHVTEAPLNREVTSHDVQFGIVCRST
jgi:hypothetical protein